MKTILTIIFIMTTTIISSAQDGKAKTVRTTFSRETSVSIRIEADTNVIWALITSAADYPRWNPTIVSITGNIAAGEKIKLVSKLDPKRTFKLRIKEFVPAQRMSWGDGKGSRHFVLSKNSDGSVTFSMNEKIGGLMFPMYAKYIPPFDESFEQFASSLKKEAETIMKTK